MTEQSREQRRAEIAARVEKATPGEWETGRTGDNKQCVYRASTAVVLARAHEKNAAFIAHARSDAPWLLSELARVEAALAESEAARVETCAALACILRDQESLREWAPSIGIARRNGEAHRVLEATPSALAAQVRARHLREAADALDGHDGGPERLDVYDGHDAARWLRALAEKETP